MNAIARINPMRHVGEMAAILQMCTLAMTKEDLECLEANYDHGVFSC